MDLDDLTRLLRDFVRERDWEPFQSPKNLSMALAVEVSELLEHFQWLTQQESADLPPETLAAVEDEMADVLIYLVRLADRLGVDLMAAAEGKMERNGERYPAELVRGTTQRPGK